MTLVVLLSMPKLAPPQALSLRHKESKFVLIVLGLVPPLLVRSFQRSRLLLLITKTDFSVCTNDHKQGLIEPAAAPHLIQRSV